MKGKQKAGKLSLAVLATAPALDETAQAAKTFGGGTLVRLVLGVSSDGKRRYDLIVWRRPDGQTI